MPLTKKQKTFLIFKKFTGLSDDSLLRNYGMLHRQRRETPEESFDSLTENKDVDSSPSMEALTNIDKSDVNSDAIDFCVARLIEMGGQMEVSNMVSKYSREMDDLYRRNHLISYPDFEKVMLRLIHRDMKQNKALCYAAISSLAKSDLIREHGANRKWWLEFLVENFSDVADSMYDQSSGTSV